MICEVRRLLLASLDVWLIIRIQCSHVSGVACSGCLIVLVL